MSTYKGRVAEYLFAAECSRRGLVYCFPSMESIPFDAVVVKPCGATLKVQVKSTFKEQSDRALQLDIRKPNGSRRYAQTAYDYLILYIDWRQDFYIIPKHVVGDNQSIRVGDIYEKYKNNWEPLL